MFCKSNNNCFLNFYCTFSYSFSKVHYDCCAKDGMQELPSLEDFLSTLKSIFSEKVMCTRSVEDDTVKAVFVPSILAPSMRWNCVQHRNVKEECVSQRWFFDKDKIIGKFY